MTNHQVHAPGISLIGANNFARPLCESSPGNWTGQDDCQALLIGVLFDWGKLNGGTAR